MSRESLLAGTAIALLMCCLPASAQQASGEEKRSPSPTATPTERTQPKQREGAANNGRPSDAREGAAKGSAGGAAENTPGKRAEDAQRKTPNSGKDSSKSGNKSGAAGGAARRAEDGAQKGAEHGARTDGVERKGAKEGSAGQTERGQGRTSATVPEQKGNNSGTSREAGRSPAPGAGRMQLSEQQHTSVHDTLLKERNVNRVAHVDFAIAVGTRVPRTLRLAVLPATVVTLVPQFRSYRYFVSGDEICIVDPATYEIVDVIGTGRAAHAGQPTHAALTLTPEEQRRVLEGVRLEGGSTLGLGALTEGAPVPRDLHVTAFSDALVRDIPKLRNYTYFTAEDRVAIVDPKQARVALVIHR
jgi:hypothetical protein